MTREHDADTDAAIGARRQGRTAAGNRTKRAVKSNARKLAADCAVMLRTLRIEAECNILRVEAERDDALRRLAELREAQPDLARFHNKWLGVGLFRRMWNAAGYVLGGWKRGAGS